ncbi:unnamed protein product, partial [Polarella glacialis]
ETADLRRRLAPLRLAAASSPAGRRLTSAHCQLRRVQCITDRLAQNASDEFSNVEQWARGIQVRLAWLLEACGAPSKVKRAWLMESLGEEIGPVGAAGSQSLWLLPSNAGTNFVRATTEPDPPASWQAPEPGNARPSASAGPLHWTQDGAEAEAAMPGFREDDRQVLTSPSLAMQPLESPQVESSPSNFALPTSPSDRPEQEEQDEQEGLQRQELQEHRQGAGYQPEHQMQQEKHEHQLQQDNELQNGDQRQQWQQQDEQQEQQEQQHQQHQQQQHQQHQQQQLQQQHQ